MAETVCSLWKRYIALIISGSVLINVSAIAIKLSTVA